MPRALNSSHQRFERRSPIKRFITVTAAAIALLAGSLAAAEAQPGNNNRNDNRYDNRSNDHRNDVRGAGNNNRFDNRRNWRKGGRIERNDWNRGRRVDYHTRKLQRPPRGYEWREVDGNYVMAAMATGLIASIILSGR